MDFIYAYEGRLVTPGQKSPWRNWFVENPPFAVTPGRVIEIWKTLHIGFGGEVHRHLGQVGIRFRPILHREFSRNQIQRDRQYRDAIKILFAHFNGNDAKLWHRRRSRSNVRISRYQHIEVVLSWHCASQIESALGVCHAGRNQHIGGVTLGNGHHAGAGRKDRIIAGL
jgi:hypothetical protein